jgi:choline dehydrogenase-like flavoprotein
MSDSPVYVIGSGPASISCAQALADDGYPVVILDAGLELEAQRQHALDALLASPNWDEATLAPFKADADATVRGIPVKKRFGSDYPYREVLEHLDVRADEVTTFASFAKGGLSTVWGAAVLPYRAEDIADWPITARELEPYYKAVFDFLPLAAIHDDLAEMFPLHCETYKPFKPSWQAKRLLEHLNSHREHLRAKGFTYGASRLALQTQPREGHKGCIYCGLCMYGCPQNAIYSAVQTLEHLVRQKQVCYVQNVVVDRLEETGETVRIHAHDRGSGASKTFDAARVFLGSGVFPTAKILLKSLQQPGATLTMRDSQYFLLPLLGWYGAASFLRTDVHTLSQVFIEMTDQALGDHPVHLQLYTYNDLYAQALKRVLGKPYPLLKYPANLLLDRLMVIQGYLHSDLSGSAAISLQGDTLAVQRQVNPATAKTVRRVMKKLSRHAFSLGFVPLSPLRTIGNPGQGSHCGGTFPMRHHPGNGETDIYGRPVGLRRVHVVDASVLPSIPSTTITLTVMANAYRIGKEWHHGLS